MKIRVKFLKMMKYKTGDICHIKEIVLCLLLNRKLTAKFILGLIKL